DRLDERARENAIPKPPTGHRERLAEPVEEDRAFGHAILDRDRAVLSVVHELAVDLVGEDPEITLARDRGDVADRFARAHATGRVVGAVEDEDLRSRADEAAELIQILLEVVLLAQRQRHSARTRA